MALSKNTVKTWFGSRAKPLATQFAQWIDACWFKGEMIPVTDIAGLDVYLGATVAPIAVVIEGLNGDYTIPAGYAVHRVYASVSSDFAIITIKDELGEVVYLDDTRIDAGTTTAIDATIVADVATTIFFYIDAADSDLITTLKIYLHKI